MATRTYALPRPGFSLGPSDRERLSRLGRFLVVGGTGVAVNSVALFVLHELAYLPLLAASALAVELAIASNFFWNNRWTFGRTELSAARFARFNAVSLVGLAITTSTLWALTTFMGVHYLAANLVGIGLATAWNFAVNLRWTWGLER